MGLRNAYRQGRPRSGAVGAVSLLALGLVFGRASAAGAQAGSGSVVGHVVTCRLGGTSPAAGIVVRVEGTDVSARSGDDGEFTLSGLPAPAFVTVDAGEDASGAPEARRYNVPTTPDGLVDIGDIPLGGAALTGCEDGDDSGG